MCSLRRIAFSFSVFVASDRADLDSIGAPIELDLGPMRGLEVRSRRKTLPMTGPIYSGCIGIIPAVRVGVTDIRADCRAGIHRSSRRGRLGMRFHRMLRVGNPLGGKACSRNSKQYAS